MKIISEKSSFHFVFVLQINNTKSIVIVVMQSHIIRKIEDRGLQKILVA